MALTFDDEQAAKLLDALGLPADTTDVETVLATVDLAAQAAGLNPEKPSTVAAAARKAGLEVVDTATLAALRHDAQEARTLKAAAQAQKIEAAVDDAISKGKIAPARRKHWVALIQADPGMAEVLASVPNETAVPMTEIRSLDRGRAPRTSPRPAPGSTEPLNRRRRGPGTAERDHDTPAHPRWGCRANPPPGACKRGIIRYAHLD